MMEGVYKLKFYELITNEIRIEKIYEILKERKVKIAYKVLRNCRLVIQVRKLTDSA